MSNPRNSIQERLTRAQIAIGNALADPAVQSALDPYGYTAERLREGQALRERALTLHQQQRVAYGDLSSANDALKATQAHVRTDYMHDIKVARVAFATDRGTLQKLDAAGERRQTQAAWLIQAQQFYANALSDPAILDALAGYGITRQRLEAGKRQIDAVGACYAARRSRRGAAQAATKVRDEALTALDAWMRDFRQIARLALKKQPQHLEKLGVVVRA
jgi:hypothetical protein